MKAALLVLGVAACGVPAGGTYVSAPAVSSSSRGPAVPALAGQAATSPTRSPNACRDSWALEDVPAGDARMLVVCGNDVRREPIVVGAMSRAIDPGLESAHQRVCTCASRMAAPQFVDLVVTAVPEEGRAGVETSEPEGEVDPGVASAFAACVGKITASFPRFEGGGCPGAEKTTFVYSFDVELGR